MNKTLLLLLAVGMIGCAGSDDGAMIAPETASLEGTWEYVPTNAYQATFTGCSGEASALEGMIFVDAMREYPICIVSGSFVMVRTEQGLEVVPHEVPCAGGQAAVSGSAVVQGVTIAGSWETASDQGISSVQTFTAVQSGDALQISETSRTFTGDLTGSCNLSPPLQATVAIR